LLLRLGGRKIERIDSDEDADVAHRRGLAVDVRKWNDRNPPICDVH
jgi:hypothetical protein